MERSCLWNAQAQMKHLDHNFPQGSGTKNSGWEDSKIQTGVCWSGTVFSLHKKTDLSYNGIMFPSKCMRYQIQGSVLGVGYLPVNRSWVFRRTQSNRLSQQLWFHKDSTRSTKPTFKHGSKGAHESPTPNWATIESSWLREDGESDSLRAWALVSTTLQ